MERKRYGGFAQLEDVFAQYADRLSDVPVEPPAFRSKSLGVSRMDCAWSINDSGH